MPTTTLLSRLAAYASSRLGRQFAWYAAIGMVGTGLYFGLYNLARLRLEPFAANAAAVGLSMGFSFVANRRFTFKRRGRERWIRQAAEFTVVFLTTLAISSAALVVLFSWRSAPAQLEENLALAASTGAVFLIRFALLRAWVFHPTR